MYKYTYTNCTECVICTKFDPRRRENLNSGLYRYIVKLCKVYTSGILLHPLAYDIINN